MITRLQLTGLLLLAAASAPVPAWELPQDADDVHLGVASCASGVCHGSIQQRQATDVLQNEYVVWSRLDRHRQAYRTLLSAESQAIAAKLGLDNAHEAGVCLDCHADNVGPGQRGKVFVMADGVGCEACHGGGADYLSLHTDPGVTRSALVDAGLYPTDDPVARARLCLSCHMGNTQKMATHDMMGAGHPRLSFELDTFMVLMPAHHVVDEDFRRDKWSGEPINAWMVGQIEAARQSLVLIETRLPATGLFPELALFDCHACHHPMSAGRWQAQDRAPLPPGSVRLSDAHFVMLFLIAEVLAPEIDSQLRAGIRGLHADVTGAQPVDERIGELLAHLDRLSTLALAPVAQHAPQLLEQLLALSGSGRVIDYAIAEQAAMAADMLLSTLGQRQARIDWLDAVYATLEQEDSFDPAAFAHAVRGTTAAGQ